TTAPTTTAPTTTAPTTTAPTTTAPTTTAPTPPAAAGPPIRPGYQGGDAVRLGALDVIGFGSRTYLPALGRFLQRDPVVGGSGNPYAYTDGDPINGHDTSGNFTEWFESLDWQLIGTWTAAVAVTVAGAALANAAGPAAGLFVANRIPGSATALSRVIARTATSALVGAGIGTGAAAGTLAVLGGDLSVTNLSYGAAAGAAVGLIRPALFIRQLRSSGLPLSTRVVGRDTTASLRMAWVEFKRGFGSKATYTEALSGPTIFNQPAERLSLSKVSSGIDELDIQTQEIDPLSESLSQY
ncbi:MAG: RHS repeat-associated core domain-containing protein, partial [Microthrixaceae bacterium]